MSQLVIEVPQNINRSYQVDDSEFGERLLQNLEVLKKSRKPKKFRQ